MLTMKKKEDDWSAKKHEDRPKKETLKKQQERRDREPVFYCKVMAKHPLKCFVFTLGCHLFMFAVSGILLATQYDILPINTYTLPVNLRNEPWQGRVYAWFEKTNYPGFYNRNPSVGYRSQPTEFGNTHLYFEMNDKSNVLTRENLLWMEKLENQLVAVPGYEKYCQLDLVTRNCTKPISLMRYFDGTYHGVNSTFYDPNFERVQEVLKLAATHPDTKTLFLYFLGTGSTVNEATVSSWITRSTIPFGFPVEEYLDDHVKYRRNVGEWTSLSMEPILKDHIRSDGDNFQFNYRSQLVWYYLVRTQAYTDILWAGASIAFIYSSMLFHTRSVWITTFAMFSVVASFVTTNLIYNIVMQFRYLGLFHGLSLFIILGIGADDIFIFFDVWQNTASEEYLSTAHRMSDAYMKSATSMFFTSLTTSVAFFSNTISPLLATRSFGIFTGTIVMVNYISVIIYFPTVVLVYHTYFEEFHWPCVKCLLKCCKSSHMDKDKKQFYNSRLANHLPNKKYHSAPGSSYSNKTYQMNKSHDLPSNLTGGCTPKKTLTVYQSVIMNIVDKNREVFEIKHDFTDIYADEGHLNSVYIADETMSEHLRHKTNPGKRFSDINGNANEAGVGIDAENIEHLYKRTIDVRTRKKPLLARFFRETYFNFVINKYVRWIMLTVMAGTLGFFIYEATKLEADNEVLDLLPDDHPYQIAMRHRLDSFLDSYGDETLILYVLWGLKQNDMSVCQFSEAECYGELVIDDSFDPNPEQNQRALLEFCETLQNMDDGRANLLRLRKSLETQKYEVRCFYQNLADFLAKDSLINGHNLSFPYTKENVLQFMSDRPQLFNVSQLNDNFTDYLQIPISYWLSNKYAHVYTDDFGKFDHLIGEQTSPYSLLLKSDNTKYYANTLRYVAVEINTTIKYRILGHEEGIPIRDEWEAFMGEQMAKMPAGLKNGFQTDIMSKWHMLSVQQMLIQNAIYGIVIGMCLAFSILVIATENIVVGTLATFSLCCCTVCVIGVIPLGGWKLGAIESLNLCMVMGLSVDYVVHLAQAYTSSLHTDRQSRVKDMLDEIGTSVLFGSITSLGAAACMFFAVLTFFKQFGTFLFSTIGFSLFFSLGMFTTLMGLIGPQNNFGNIRVPFKIYCGRRSD